MSDDIRERLAYVASQPVPHAHLCRDARREIDRLRSRNEQLEAGLRSINEGLLPYVIGIPELDTAAKMHQRRIEVLLADIAQAVPREARMDQLETALRGFVEGFDELDREEEPEDHEAAKERNKKLRVYRRAKNTLSAEPEQGEPAEAVDRCSWCGELREDVSWCGCDTPTPDGGEGALEAAEALAPVRFSVGDRVQYAANLHSDSRGNRFVGCRGTIRTVSDGGQLHVELDPGMWSGWLWLWPDEVKHECWECGKLNPAGLAGCGIDSPTCPTFGTTPRHRFVEWKRGICERCDREKEHPIHRSDSEPAPTPDGGEGAMVDLQWLEQTAATAHSTETSPEYKASLSGTARRKAANVRRALREPRVPEAVQGLPELMRSAASVHDPIIAPKECDKYEAYYWAWGYRFAARHFADELDRALAQSEQGRVPPTYTAAMCCQHCGHRQEVQWHMDAAPQPDTQEGESDD